MSVERCRWPWLHLPARGALDGADDPAVGPAAAEIAVHRLHDLRTRGLRRLRQQGRGLHDLARLTVAALKHLLGDPRLLRRMTAIRRQAFDCRDPLAFDGLHPGHAGPHGLTVDVHGTGAAHRDAAAVLRAGELELLAQHPQQGLVRLRRDVHLPAVEYEDHEDLLGPATLIPPRARLVHPRVTRKSRSEWRAATRKRPASCPP